MDKDLNNYTSSNHGFVYILSNPTMPGLLKIGMTRFGPSRRVQELSSATGVPTPFNLVYYREFSNCVVAETEIHSILASKGLRYNNQREFFSIDTVAAINTLLSLPDKSGEEQHLEQIRVEDFNKDVNWSEFEKNMHEIKMNYLQSDTFLDCNSLIVSHLCSEWNDEDRQKLQTYVDNGAFAFIEILSSVLYNDDIDKRIEFILDYTSKGYVSGFVNVVQLYLESVGGIGNVEPIRKFWIAQQLNSFAKNFKNASSKDVHITQNAADYCGISNALGLQYDKNLLNAFDLTGDDIFEFSPWLYDYSGEGGEKSKELCAKLRADKDSFLGISTELRYSIVNDEKYKVFHSMEGESFYNQGTDYLYGLNGFNKDKTKAEFLLRKAIDHGFKKAYYDLSIIYYGDKIKYEQILRDGISDSCPLCLMLAAGRILDDICCPEELSKSLRNKISRYLDLFIAQIDEAFCVDAKLCLDAIKNYISISVALQKAINKNAIKPIIEKIRAISDINIEDYYFNMGNNISCFYEDFDLIEQEAMIIMKQLIGIS